MQEVNWRTATYAQHEVYACMKMDAGQLNRPANWDWWKPLTDVVVEAGKETWAESAGEATRNQTA